MTVGSGTRTILFTDMVGSTALRSRLGDRVVEQFRRDHDALLADAVVAHSGTVVKNTGDGVMAVFEGAGDASACAVAMQQAIDRYRRKREVALEIRVGLSAGDVTWENDDYFGTPVVEAARLESAARAGQILASEVVRVLAGSRTDVAFTSVGALDLKGLGAALPACEIVWVALPARHEVPLPSASSVNGAMFVGREAEWDRLDTAWKRAAAGDRTVVVLVGEPGIGKTRLAVSFAGERHEAGALVLFGRCDEGLTVPYQPFVEALRHYAQHSPEHRLIESLGRHPHELVLLVPELRDVVGPIPAPVSADDDTQQYQLFEAVASWLTTAAAADGVVLLLDDLQWAARPTLLMLRHLLRNPIPGLLVIMTVRAGADAETAKFLSELSAVAETERVDLLGLDEANVADLVASASPPGADVSDAARRITEVSSGNPFFVTQIVADFSAAPTSLQALAEHVPTGVRDAVMRRLTAISPASRDALTHAAILGLEFDVSVLEAWETDRADVLTALEEAARASLVEEADLGRFRFVHALVATTIVDDLGATRRTRLHAHAGAAIERAFPDRLDEFAGDLAHHYSLAAATSPTSRERAAHYSITAGRSARAQYAFEDAVAHYGNALALLPADGPVLVRCDVLLALGEAQMRAGDARARETLLEAARIAETAGDAQRLARAALENNPGFWNQLGSSDAERVEVIELALDRCGERDLASRARLLSLLAIETMWDRPNQEGRALVDKALGIARSLGDDATLAYVLMRREMIIQRPSDHDERCAMALELREIADRTNDVVLRLRACGPAFSVAFTMGDADEARRCLTEEVRLMEELGQSYWRWGFLISHGPADALRRGQFEEAERLADEGFQIGSVIRNPGEALGYWGATIGATRFEQGRLGELVSLIEAAIDVHTSPSQVRQTLVLAHLENGDHERAQHVVDAFSREELAPLIDIGINHLPMGARLGEIASRLGDRDWAQYAFDLLEPYAGRIATETIQYWGAVDRYLGLTSAVLGDVPAAIAHLESAIEVDRRAEAPTWEARTRLDLARILAARSQGDDIARAASLAQEAVEVAERFGMRAVARDAGALLAVLQP